MSACTLVKFSGASNSEDNSSHSEIVIGIGSSRSGSAFNNRPRMNRILLDLNHLPDDSKCPCGCKLDVYCMVRHRAGCPHRKLREFELGTRTFDYIGKATYPFQQEGIDDDFASDQRCEEFTQRCDKLLTEMRSKSAITRNRHLSHGGPFYQIIDEVNKPVIQTKGSGRFCHMELRESELDLYDLKFLEEERL